MKGYTLKDTPNNIYTALAAFQQEVKAIGKDSKAYTYNYASLDHIVETITPLLKKHKLGFSQPLGGDSVRTILFHTPSGETIESEINIPQGIELKGMNSFQVLGSGITYLRRYSLSSILGLVTDEDIDAQGEQTTSTGSTGYAPSTKQLEFIRSLAEKKGIEGEDLDARIAAIKTADQASAAITKLKG